MLRLQPHGIEIGSILVIERGNQDTICRGSERRSIWLWYYCQRMRTKCGNKIDEEIDGLIEKLEQGVLDPQISDYIFWSEMSPEEIADKALRYKPIEL